MSLSVGKCLLRGIRKSAGLTQEELALLLKKELGIDVTKQMISHYETNKKVMNVLMLKAMSLVLERITDDFYTFNGIPPNMIK